MKIGYIHADWGEQERVQQVLNALNEPGAIDELGIGRIRDAFADRLFPGISTLQKRVKYFSLMPQLYLKVADVLVRRGKKVTELDVAREILTLERIMTKNLLADKNTADKNGITGSDQIKIDKFVKYDPAYIYNSGLLTYNIIGRNIAGKTVAGNPRKIIASIVNGRLAEPERLVTDDENIANDDKSTSNLFQYFRNPGVYYDFTKECSIIPTDEDKEFIVGSMLNSEACKGTLLHFLVENRGKLHFADCDFHAVAEVIKAANLSLPAELADLHRRASIFSDFIYILYLRYNYILSQNNGGTYDNDVLGKFIDEVEKYKSHYQPPMMEEILDGLLQGDQSPVKFCKDAEQFLLAGDKDKYTELEKILKKREERIKSTRKKLGTSFVYNPNRRVHFYKLDFRWATFRGFLKEL